VLETALPFRKKASLFIPVMLLVLVGAMQFAPFASFDDKTLVSDDNGEYLTEEGQVEGDLSGYGERFELGNMAPVLLELQWPLIMTGELLGG